MPVLKGSLGSWDVEHLHYWRDRGILPSPPSIPLISLDSRIATIGSCFAENVSRVLYDRGFDIEMHPAGLWYNTFSIFQEISHIFEKSPYDNEPMWQTDDGRWLHPFKDYHKQFKTREELNAWSDDLDTKARKLFKEAEIIIITLGLTEIWENPVTGNVFIQLPPPDIYNKDIATFRPSGMVENLRNLENTYAAIKKNTEAKIIITVSPVPLYATFRKMDVRVANNISKSTLRTAVAEFVEFHEDVYYFHSYELVNALDYPGQFMEDDGRHIRKRGVELIIDEFLRMYGNSSLKVQTRDVSWLEKGKIGPDNKDSVFIKKVKRRLRRKFSKILGRPL